MGFSLVRRAQVPSMGSGQPPCGHTSTISQSFTFFLSTVITEPCFNHTRSPLSQCDSVVSNGCWLVSSHSICNFLASEPSPFSSCLHALAATQAGAQSSSSLRVQMVHPVQVRSQHWGMCMCPGGGGGHRTAASCPSERREAPLPSFEQSGIHFF